MLEINFKLGSEKAYHGQAALDAVKERFESGQQHFQFIFMDISMPIMDGYQATEKIREFEAKQLNNSQRAYIIGLTAHASEYHKQKCFESGMDVFLTKPISNEKLGEVLNSLQMR